MKNTVVVLASTALVAVLVCGSALADTFTVTNTKDSGPGSLRTAITSANANPGRDVISFAPSVRGNIGLKSELPLLRAELEIRGPGVGRLTVRRDVAKPFRIFAVVAPAGDQTVTISGLTISNGLATGGRDRGGGVLSRGNLILRGVVVSGNSAEDSGGGIYNQGIMTIEKSTVSANSGASGISNHGTLTIVDSTISGNNSSGIFNDDELTVTNSTLSRNSAENGGAIFNGGTATSGAGRAVIWGSTFSRNTASSEGACGGAICNIGGEVLVTNSTFTGNRALGTSGACCKGTGGAINNDTGSTLTVTSSTFAGNTANGQGGGIFNYNEIPGFEGTTRLRATIVANNEAPTGPNVSGPVTSRGYNLVGDPSGATGFRPTDLTGGGPGLDPRGLRDNGGPTETIALTGASPALDAVAAGCPPPIKDQRGVSRPQDGDGEGAALCDIGAFERGAASP